jgi:hypothetical protein
MRQCHCGPWWLDGVRRCKTETRETELTIVDQRGQKQTDGDAQLVGTNDETTNPLGKSLGLVHGNLDRDKTDTETSEESTGNEHTLLGGSDLKNDTEVERNGSADNDTPLAASDVGDETSSQGTDKGTD